MKIQMNNIPALCFLVMLSIRIVGGVKCLGCSNVGPDNMCRTKPYECIAGKWRFCYMEKFSRLRNVLTVRKGCTSFCKTEFRAPYLYRFQTVCCYRDHCNSLNYWY